MAAKPRQRRRNRCAPDGPGKAQRVRLYGRHPVAAALANPARRRHRLWASRKGLAALDTYGVSPGDLPVETVEPDRLTERAGRHAPHQGLVLEVAPLDPPRLDDIAAAAGPGLILLLDQVADPQNVGAVLRTAAAFGARAVITQKRHSPAESGALAKAASGALDVLPWLRAANLAQSLDRLAAFDYWRLALSGAAEVRLDTLDLPGRLVLALGSEGKGLRPRVWAHCDLAGRIPLAPASPLIDSLNVSAAAAAALYACAAHREAG